MIRILREIWLFFWRDLTIARTYRTVFVLEAIEALFGAAMFYYVARFVDTPALQQALPQGGSYFAFSLVGFVFLDYLNAALDTFDRSLEESRDTGTLEHLLVTQTSLPVFVRGVSHLSLRRHNAAHRRLCRLGRGAFWISAARRELARGFRRPAGHVAGIFRARNSFRELSSAVQTRQSREMVFPGSFERRRGHAFSGQHFAGLAASGGAAQSRHLRAGCDARLAPGRSGHRSVVAPSCHFARSLPPCSCRFQ